MNIIVGRNGKETIARIAEKTGANVEARYTLRSGVKVWRKNFQKQQRGYRPTVDGITINWAVEDPEGVTYNGVVYNEHGVLNASNKPKARRLMAEAGVSIPETTTSRSVASTWLSECSVIRRPSIHHGGADFVVTERCGILPLSGYAGDYYYQKFFRKTHEFRVHGAHGKVLILQEKKPREGIEVDLDVPKPWNHATGEFIFETVNWSNYNKDVCKVALDAIKALGLDFGAVDILYDTDSGEAVVCEVNTSPALEDYAVERYSKYFKWLCNSDTRREHFDYSEYSQGKSYAWKNYQLADEEVGDAL